MTRNKLGQVRRRYMRAEIPSTAFLFIGGSGFLGPFEVENLSAGGALLKGSGSIEAGKSVQVQLSLSGLPPIHVKARVVRSEDKGSLAVAFCDLLPETEDRIQTVVLAQLESSRALGHSAVLVLDESAEEREALRRDIESLGHRAIAVGTPLDALRWLQDQRLWVELVLVDLLLRQTSAHALDVLALLAEDFPGAQRVLMSREAHSTQLDEVTSSGMAHAILLKPWDRESLAKVVGTMDR